MTTAREALARQLRDLMKNAPVADAQNKVTSLMDEYRVQAKPGTEVQAGLTARESLGRQVAALWTRSPKDVDRAVEALLDKYRMQLKRGGADGEADSPSENGAARPAATKPKPADPPRGGSAEPRPAAKAAASPAVRKSAAAAAAPGPAALPPPRVGGGVASAMPPRAAPQSVTPLFPGTPTGPSRRSECPKCKSRGVVLARAYTHEEYYSCIYCGWQAFKPFEEATQDSPLAARLLAQRPNAPVRKKEDDEPEAPRRRSLFGEDDDGPRTRSVIRDDDEPLGRPGIRPADALDEEEDMGGMHEVDDPSGDETFEDEEDL